MSIHPSAVVAPGAVVPDSCTVGPYCTIGPNVVLGEDCTLISHVVLDGHTRIGARNTFYSFCAIGVSPQDLKYGGEPTALAVTVKPVDCRSSPMVLTSRSSNGWLPLADTWVVQ